MTENRPTSTTTVEEEQPQTGAILHLRQDKKKKSKSKVRWTEDVVDNEHMGKKKSKICCIFHPQRDFGELSSESSSGSDLSDSEDEHCCHYHERSPSPNAYERQPKK